MAVSVIDKCKVVMRAGFTVHLTISIAVFNTLCLFVIYSIIHLRHIFHNFLCLCLHKMWKT